MNKAQRMLILDSNMAIRTAYLCPGCEPFEVGQTLNGEIIIDAMCLGDTEPHLINSETKWELTVIKINTKISIPPKKGWVLEDGTKILEVFPGDMDEGTKKFMGEARIETSLGEVKFINLNWWIDCDGNLIH
jgi:hypothetical protein